MLDIDVVHKFPLREDFTEATIRRARAAVAWRVIRENWTAQELRDVLRALGIEGETVTEPDPNLPNPMRPGERAKPVIWLLTDGDIEELARYNAERARGIVHTDEWRAKMAQYQAAFDLQRGTQPLPSRKKRRWGA